MTGIHSGARPIRWRWIAAMWCAGGLLEASQAVLILRFVDGRRHAWLPLFATELATWLPWALATPLIISLARRYPIVRGMTVRTVAVHLAACATISTVAEAWSALLQVLFSPSAHRQPPTFWDAWSTTLLYHALIFVIAYALILTITYLVDSRENIARQMTETARLNEELSKAQLAALRRQMEPHFMFNTLNSIAGLVRDHRNDAAVSMIVGLSEFLRRASSDSHRSQVTLAEEVEYLQRYVDIQKVRFGERLRVSVDIPADSAERTGSESAAAAVGRKRHQARRCQARSGRERPRHWRAQRRQRLPERLQRRPELSGRLADERCRRRPRQSAHASARSCTAMPPSCR